MDYEVGSIADLISGDRTPNRPKISKKPLTPMKPSTPPSRNVTPRDNKNLSKAKTPKIAFTPESAKKRGGNKSQFDSPKSASNKRKSKLFNTFLAQENTTPNRKSSVSSSNEDSAILMSPKSKRSILPTQEDVSPSKKSKGMSPQKSKDENSKTKNNSMNGSVKKIVKEEEEESKSEDSDDAVDQSDEEEESVDDENDDIYGALPENDSDSEHQSDNELPESDNEEKIKETAELEEGSDNEKEDEDEPTAFEKAAAKRIEKKEQKEEKFDPSLLARTLFVGNIPISILKKNHERVLRSKFAPYGTVESLRIRNIPVPDLKTKPKLAFIEKNFHAERSTVNAYIVFAEESSVEKALVENNSLMDGYHLRVDRCHATKKVPVDPRKSLFCGGLPFSVEEEDLRKFFSKCGDIDSIRIVRDRVTQIGKGIAFINFTNSDGVELALAMDEEDIKLNNKQFRIQRYNSTEKRGGGNKRNQGQQGNNNNRAGQKRPFQNRNPQKRDGNKPPFGKKGDGNRQFGNKRDGNKPFMNKKDGFKPFGKKRDEQGNKNRKRNFNKDFNKNKNENNKVTNNDGPPKKKFKNNTEESGGGNERPSEKPAEKKMNWMEKQNEYKGLVAKKKKKMKQNQMSFEKKKLSKILTQPPKAVASED